MRNYFENLFWGRKKTRRACARIADSRHGPRKNAGNTGKKWKADFPWVVENECGGENCDKFRPASRRDAATWASLSETCKEKHNRPKVSIERLAPSSTDRRAS
jgi:hypothetical protein